jgi:Zn-dependent protease with chaperone function
LKGQLFGPGPGPGESCDIEVGAHAILARTHDRVIELPFAASTFTTGGLNGTLGVVERKDGAGGLVVLQAPLAELRARLEAVGAPMVREARSGLARESARHARRTLLGWVVGLGVIAAIVAGAVVGSNRAVEWFVTSVPAEWEDSLGESLLEAAAPASARIQSGPVFERVQLVMARLTEAAQPSPYEFEVAIIPNEQPNAFALPGGHLAVHDSLVVQCETADELAGVLAHEIGHVRGRHHLRSLAHRLKWSLLLSSLTGDVGGAQQIIISNAGDLLLLKHDRDQERDADRAAIDLSWEAGFDPNGMVRLFERFAKEEASTPGLAAFLSTHPGGAERAQAVRDELARRGDPPVRPIEAWPAIE